MARDQAILDRTVQEALRRAKLLFQKRVATASTSGSGSGLVPTLPNDATKYLDGTGEWSVPAGGGGGGGGASSAELTDLTDLVAWYSADNANNTVAPNTGVVTVFHDKSGNGRHFTPGSGTILKQYAQLAGSPVVSFASAMTANSQVTLPLKGALTFFGVFFVTSSATYQTLFHPGTAPNDPTDLHLFWDQPSNKWQIDGRLSTTAGVAGRWLTLLVHYYNSGGSMNMKARENGASVLAGIASTVPAHPVPGSGGSPANYDLCQFIRASNDLPFTSKIAEWGYYATTRDGSEATLESYLRAKYSTW